jgi:hypothetical protein
VNNASAQAFGDFDGLVRRSIVADDHLSLDAAAGEGRQGFLDTDAQRPFLVQARNDGGNDYLSLRDTLAGFSQSKLRGTRPDPHVPPNPAFGTPDPTYSQFFLSFW